MKNKLEYTKLTLRDAWIHLENCILYCSEIGVEQVLAELAIRFKKTFGDKDGI